MTLSERKVQVLTDYKKRLNEHRELEGQLKDGRHLHKRRLVARFVVLNPPPPVRMGIRDLEKDFDKTEDNIKALQSVGQIIGEVLKQLDEERCKCAEGRY